MKIASTPTRSAMTILWTRCLYGSSFSRRSLPPHLRLSPSKAPSANPSRVPKWLIKLRTVPSFHSHESHCGSIHCCRNSSTWPRPVRTGIFCLPIKVGILTGPKVSCPEKGHIRLTVRARKCVSHYSRQDEPTKHYKT